MITPTDDIVIVGSYRTPITKAKKEGGMAHLKNNEILFDHLVNTLGKVNISPEKIDYVCIGNVLSEMNGTIDARHACLRAGIPVNVPVMTVNRQCASGLESFETAKNMLLLKKCKVALVGGFESMSTHEIPVGNINDHDDSESAKGCLLTMIQTSDRVASSFKLTREEIDNYAYQSHCKAFKSLSNNSFEREILPFKDVKQDNCIRKPDREKMKTLRTCYEGGVTTAANASQLSDGCSLALLMTRETANDLGLEIMGIFVDYFVVGVEPSIMGVGPSEAIPELLKRNNLKIENVELFEINEAFASQALYCQRKLGIPDERLNVKGGSLAIGHPVGCSGARLVSTLLHSLEKGYGVVSLCAGTGHGVAALIKKC